MVMIFKNISFFFQFVRSILERVVPYVIKMSLPISDVRDVAAAHITAMTSPKASGKQTTSFPGPLYYWAEGGAWAWGS